MANKVPYRVTFDACTVISMFDENDPAQSQIEAIVELASNGEIEIHVSTCIFPELIYIGDPIHHIHDVLEYRRHLDNSYYTFVDATLAHAQTAQEIRAFSGIGGMDAMHVATAIVEETPILITRDGQPDDSRRSPKRRSLVWCDNWFHLGDWWDNCAPTLSIVSAGSFLDRVALDKKAETAEDAGVDDAPALFKDVETNE